MTAFGFMFEKWTGVHEKPLWVRNAVRTPLRECAVVLFAVGCMGGELGTCPACEQKSSQRAKTLRRAAAPLRPDLIPLLLPACVPAHGPLCSAGHLVLCSSISLLRDHQQVCRDI